MMPTPSRPSRGCPPPSIGRFIKGLAVASQTGESASRTNEVVASVSTVTFHRASCCYKGRDVGSRRFWKPNLGHHATAMRNRDG
jgi:hypothetical protein